MTPSSRLSLQPNVPFSIGNGKFTCNDRQLYPLPPSICTMYVKIGNFPEILMSSLNWQQKYENSIEISVCSHYWRYFCHSQCFLSFSPLLSTEISWHRGDKVRTEWIQSCLSVSFHSLVTQLVPWIQCLQANITFFFLLLF